MHISRIERGEQPGSLKLAVKLAEVLSLDLNKLKRRPVRAEAA